MSVESEKSTEVSPNRSSRLFRNAGIHISLYCSVLHYGFVIFK